jgi:ABC-type antimicrobial peptide transport system permease subunit
VLKLVVGQGMGVVAIGLVVGLVGALAVTRFLQSMLFGVTASDPFVLMGVSVVVGLVALLACLIPARRASRIDPLVALRDE